MTRDPIELPGEQREDDILAEYLLRIDRGEQVDLDDFLREFPEGAEVLKSYFDDDEIVNQLIQETAPEAVSESHERLATDRRVLGNYTLIRKIGEGGMGRVFEARHERMKRVVAVKLLPQELLDSPSAVQRFQREMEAAARLSHPNVVRAYDADEDDGVSFLVMEYVAGVDLARLVNKRGPLPLGEALDYVIQAAKGLAYAHTQGIVHRDIKPSNLLLDPNGTVKVLDLGLARLVQSSDSVCPNDTTQAGAVLGTMDYMSPEQLEDTRQADARSDMYSLGCTLFFLLTGRPVYEVDSTVAKIIAHRERPVPSLLKLRDDIPQDVDAIFRRMVAKEPNKRYRSMNAVITDLEKCREVHEMIPMASPTPRALDNTEAGDIFQDTVHSPASSPHSSDRRVSSGWAKLVGAAFLGIGLLALLFGVVFKIQTPAGTVVVEVDQPNAVVEVDDGKIRITTENIGQPVEFEIDHGKHTLHVSKDGFKSETREFSIESKGKRVLHVELRPDVPPETRTPTPNTAPPAPNLSSGPSRLIGSDNNWSLPDGVPAPAIAPFDAAQARLLQEAWADYLGVPLEMTNSVGMTFVLIPPGEFMMGATEKEATWATEMSGGKPDFSFFEFETPQHCVRISRPYYLGTCEVTQGQYSVVTGWNPSRFSRDGQESKTVDGLDTTNHPVENVTWVDAKEFCRRLSQQAQEVSAQHSYRLPSEAEWEHACRAGTTTRWNGSDDPQEVRKYAWYVVNSQGHTHPVGMKLPNAWGLFDMHAGVAEWCRDWFRPDYHRASSVVDPLVLIEGTSNPIRGGAWHLAGKDCRSATRSFGAPPQEYTGFRVLCEIPATMAVKSNTD